MENNTLNGFEAVVDSLLPQELKNSDKINISDVSEELTDEELEALRNQSKSGKKEDVEPDKEEDDDDDDVTPPVKKTRKNEPKSDKDDIDVNKEDDNDDSTDETAAITAFFDALSDRLGWDDVEDDEKPKNTDDLIEYFREVIEDNSKPDFASEEIEKLDQFVRNGGNIRDYLAIDAEIDLDKVKLDDDESMQKAVVRMLLREKGFSATRIDKMVSKYEDAGILEDEAIDALEDLKEIRQNKKEQLLVQQQKHAEAVKKQQQEFFNNVYSEIKGMDSIYGIAVPEKDKKALLEYIFKPTSKGTTRYQEDYAKSLKNLVASAYFTMKGDSLINIAKKEGKKNAIDTLKNTLTKNTGVNKRSKRTVVDNDDSSVWAAFTKHLRN